MSSTLSTFRAKVKEALDDFESGAFIFDAERVHLGFVSRMQKVEALDGDVKRNGPMAFIGPIVPADSDSLQFGPVQCVVLLFLHKSKGADADFQDITELVVKVMKALANQETYGPTTLQPKNVRFADLNWAITDTDGLVTLQFNLSIPALL
jgi:hypothetical protein